MDRPRSPPPRSPSPSTAGVGEASLPLLRSTAASIFVPLTTDLLAADAPSPPPEPPAAAARLDDALAELDAHAAHVRANIRALVRRECVRILREAAADQARLAPAPPPRAPGGLAPADRAALVANMAVSHVGPVPEHLPPPDFARAREPANPQEWAAKELMAAVSRALTELKGFDAHAARARTAYQHAFEREVDPVVQ